MNIKIKIITLLMFGSFFSAFSHSDQKKPVYIGIDAEFGYKNSTSAQAIELGALIAIEEINLAGGVLGGRQLQLTTKANHSVPARSIANIKSFAAQEDLVAIFCGRFSPTVIEALETIHTYKIPTLDPWAAADVITENSYSPSYTFRLSLRDSWAMPAMIQHAQKKGATNIGLLLLNTSWGRSNLKAAESNAITNPGIKIVGKAWFNWNDHSLIDRYNELKNKGAEVIIIVANAEDAATLVNEMVELPEAERLTVISHWGITGGNFPELVGDNLFKVDFSVVQTYSFLDAKRPKANYVIQKALEKMSLDSVTQIKAPVGVAHAYDLTHILARAINLAGSTDRTLIRSSLEKVKNYDGLIRYYDQPFSEVDHNALTKKEVFIAQYQRDGSILRIGF